MKKMAAPLLAVSLLACLAACEAQVVVDGSRTAQDLAACGEACEGGEGGAGGGGAGGGGAGETHPAVAMTRAQSDALWEKHWEDAEGGSSVSSGGGADLDPNDLFLEVSSVGASCDVAHTSLSCGGQWSLSIGVPPSLQKPGVYDLSDPALQAYSYMSETGQPYGSDPDDCSWGGGSIGNGTLEIFEITTDAVRFRVEVDGLWENDPSGDYTALRCP